MMVGLSPGYLPGQTLAQGSSTLSQRWERVPERRGRSAREILEAAQRGEIDVLFLLGADPLGDMGDTEEVRSALSNVGLVVGLDAFSTRSQAEVDVVLPVALPGEYEGTTTNIEGRVSFLSQKLVPPGLSRPAWSIAAELAEYFGTTLGFSDAKELWDELSEVSSTHRGLTRRAVERESEGIVVPLARVPILPQSRTRQLDPIATPGISSVETQAPKQASASEQHRDVVVASLEDALGREMSRAAELTVPAGQQREIEIVDRGRSLSLVAYRRLYGGGVNLSHCEHLRPLMSRSVARVSSSAAALYEVADGTEVILVRGDQRSTPVELCIDDGVLEGTIEVSVDRESRILSLIESRANISAIQLERA
jgi:predicted molibdopterin-dependent oxidoreductase YjgC